MKPLPLFVLFTVALVGAHGCKSNMPINVMTMPGVCDSTPAPPDPTESGPILPAVALSTLDAAVIGTVEEEVSRHPVRGGAMDLFLADSTKRGDGPKFHVPTDMHGGFVIDSIPPGEYVLMSRSIGHQPVRRQLILTAGQTDTVRFSVRRYSCSGY